MRIIVILGMLCWATFASGQISNFPYYQRQINKAEMLIVEGNNFEALQVYQETFDRVRGNFTKDIFNAMLLAEQLNKSDDFFNLLNMLSTKCIPASEYTNCSYFPTMKQDPRWTAFVTNKTCDNQGLDTKMAAKIDQLASTTTALRNGVYSNAEIAQSLAATSNEQVADLVSIIEADGFPGESTIGSLNLQGEQSFDDILAYHAKTRSTNKDREDLKTILFRALLEGRVEPNKAALWIDFQNDAFKTGALAARLSNKETELNLPESFVTNINENRKLLHLDTLEAFVKKQKFLLNDKSMHFIFR